MMNICSTEKCTGCSACVNVCALNAIELMTDRLGFLYPAVNPDLCVKCEQCQKICPQNAPSRRNTCGDFFAGVSFNDSVKNESSSGGVFSLLAEYIIKKGGVVFGAALDDELKVKHIAVDKLSELTLLRGSKYVQSEIGDSYNQVKKCLSQGRFVLFSGTPCQIDGLYSFLKDSPKELYTVDVLCHGAPSPLAFQRYIEHVNNMTGKNISSINFRCKSTGWINFSTSITFSDKSTDTVFRGSYMCGFLNNYYLRDCCYSCRYTTKERTGDITLGDFWGYREKAPLYLEDDDRGISLVIVNNKKGNQLIKHIKTKAALVAKSYDEAAKGNPILYTPSKYPADYSEFQQDFEKLSWAELSEKYFSEVKIPENACNEELKAYVLQPFKKRYYKHLVFCKMQNLKSRLKKGMRL